MKLWPFPLIRNYHTEQWLTDLFLRMAEDPCLRVAESGPHQMVVTMGSGEAVRLWCSNRYYAYASQGAMTLPNGREAAWNNAMPSRYAVRAFVRALPRAFDNALKEQTES